MNKTTQHQRRLFQKGSILIWSVMLGFVLTSVFFFFGMRQRANVAVQRDTVEILNTRSYLKSYADYLQKNAETIGELDSEFDGIQALLTKQVDEIEGIADAGVLINYSFNDTISIEWNKCSDGFKGDLLVGENIYPHDNSKECGNADGGFDDTISSIPVSGLFSISTANAPFHYRITGTGLLDNKWHLELSTTLDYGKKIRTKRLFE